MEKKRFELTATDLKKLKAQYPNRELSLIEVKDKDNSIYSCVVKEPDRNALSVASKFIDDPVKFNEVIFANCFVDGDPEIKTNDYLLLSAQSKCATLVKFAEATIKKL